MSPEAVRPPLLP